MSRREIGARLRAIREARGLGCNEAARLAELDGGYLSRVERGHSGLTVENLYRLATVLNMYELARAVKPFVGSRRSSGGAA